ncbi:MAG: hypothetical protein FWG20_07230, partial [Candidatus Cloacimonetes bacterium]|nr:hypothetical protein [Candidatus Cloacimonadota bacterium]
KETAPVILLETPYRMKPLAKDLEMILKSNKRIIFAYKLTQPEELIIKTTVGELVSKIKDLPKGEFVIIVLP